VKPRAERIPAQPFADWLNARYAKYEAERTEPGNVTVLAGGVRPIGPAERLCGDLGWRGDGGLRDLYRHRNLLISQGKRGGGARDVPTTEFLREKVLAALDHAGVPLEDVYPALAAEFDVELEPEAFCASCHETVTPIKGCCPWCDRATSDELPERMFCAREDAMRFPSRDGSCWRCGGKLSRQIPRDECACGCGGEVVRFSVSDGRRKMRLVGHTNIHETKRELPAGPFREWLQDELRALDPIQSLSRRVGVERDLLLRLLDGREKMVPQEQVNRSLRLAAQEGQGIALGSRPGSKAIDDLYPDRGGVLTCPSCGGRKVAKAEMCRSCRLLNVGWVRPGGISQRPRSMTPPVLEEARQLRLVEGLPWREVALRVMPRTRCRTVESVRTGLHLEFRKRGWPTSPEPERRAA
jgi:hypothetical protein